MAGQGSGVEMRGVRDTMKRREEGSMMSRFLDYVGD